MWTVWTIAGSQSMDSIQIQTQLIACSRSIVLRSIGKGELIVCSRRLLSIDQRFPIRFCREFEEQSFKFQCHGAIFNKNKIEDFKTCDKMALICDEGRLIWDDIVSGRCLHTPSLFTRFIVLSFAVSKCVRFA